MTDVRTWTLHFSSAMTRPSNVHIKGPGVFAEGRTDGFRVVDGEPVADLLERFKAHPDCDDATCADIAALLTALRPS